MSYSIYDFAGNIGVSLILAAYLLIQLNKLSGQDLIYSVMNGVGASLVLFSLYYDFNLSSVIVEGFWLIISLVGIIRYFIKKNEDRTER